MGCISTRRPPTAHTTEEMWRGDFDERARHRDQGDRHVKAREKPRAKLWSTTSMSRQIGGELNKADARGVYKAMDRAGAICAFNRHVVEKLRSADARRR
jgi:hypothetical protein